MRRWVLLLGSLWTSAAAATMSAAERQSLTDAFDPLLSSRAAAEKCLSPDAATKAKFDLQFRALIMGAVGAIPPYRGEDRRALTVEAFQTVLDRYPIILEQVAETAAYQTCLGPEIKQMERTYRHVATAEGLRMPPPIEYRAMWENCAALAIPEDVRKTDHANLGKYSLLLTPDGRVIDSKIVETIGNDRFDALLLQQLSSCHFLPERRFGHPITEPAWTELSYGVGK